MTEVATNGPPACKHIFLHELARLSVGERVRFLGCIRSYDVSKAQLHVEHFYPTENSPAFKLIIDVAFILETSKRDVLDIGSWINVIGHVKISASGRNKRKWSSVPTENPTPVVVVQAVLVWNAGALRMNEYERALERQMDARRMAAEVITSYKRE